MFVWFYIVSKYYIRTIKNYKQKLLKKQKNTHCKFLNKFE